MNLDGKIVLCTGSNGFLGTHLCRVLEGRGASVFGCRSGHRDLTKPSMALKALEDIGPDLVVHCAAHVGGILANKRKPYQLAHDNLLMGANIIDACILYNVEKLVVIGTTCSYPSVPSSFPFSEDSLWEGYPDKTNAPYGLAKRMLVTLVEAAIAEKWLPCGTTAILANLYGPGDEFHPEHSHAIPAMIRRFTEAVDRGLSEVTCWGSGRATRDFLHVRDAAEGIARVCESWDLPAPINLGTGIEISILEMAELVAEITGFSGRILWSEGDGLDGQQNRALDCTRARNGLGWEAKIDFRHGLTETVAYWRDKCASSQP